jgi:hypothetical protein
VAVDGNEKESMLLTEMLPVLADELEQLLKKSREPELAAQVPQLTVVDRRRAEMTSAHLSIRNRSLKERTVPAIVAWN